MRKFSPRVLLGVITVGRLKIRFIKKWFVGHNGINSCDYLLKCFKRPDTKYYLLDGLTVMKKSFFFCHDVIVKIIQNQIWTKKF